MPVRRQPETRRAPVELVSGDDLADLLKEYQLGVVTQMVEQVTVEKHFFDQFS